MLYVCLKEGLPLQTHLTRVELVQTLIDPLLHVQPLLQLLPVVLDGDTCMPLGDVTPVVWRKVQICRVHVPMLPQGRAGLVCCHLCCGCGV